MEIADLKRKWDHLGKEDPLWAILTDPEKQGNRWDREEFFETGRCDASRFFALARFLSPEMATASALDFGCGVGRLTFGLTEFFAEVTGVDISESMITRAKELTTSTQVTFLQNGAPDLSILPDRSYDFLLSHIVLQHVPARYHGVFVTEFMRVLRPSGVALFQLPEPFSEEWGSRRFDPERKLKIDMYGSTQADVLTWVQNAGGRILQVVNDGSCGPEHLSYRYVVKKTG